MQMTLPFLQQILFLDTAKLVKKQNVPNIYVYIFFSIITAHSLMQYKNDTRLNCGNIFNSRRRHLVP